ncbi:MAG: hypothetical protein A2521_15995 [Deltaproteobacteria bacterium RIFOXYD12_FULL_57_12]|nr:MAG: hypothetical protein A2521_15995 [Deltaproteobacteria bacterium RIFOXYD12_FULL_57_12]
MKNRRLLIIDDDQGIWKAYQDVLVREQEDKHSPAVKIASLLRRNGSVEQDDFSIDFQLSFAAQGQDGYALLRESLRESSPFAVAFIDIRMPPGWDGMETAVRLRQLDPNLELVIVTAYGDRSPEEIVRALGSADKLLYLRKPFDPDELAQIALSLTEKWNLARQEELQRLEIQAVLTTTPAAIFTVNEQNIITSWNPAAERITGYLADEIVGKVCPFGSLSPEGGCQACLLYCSDKSIMDNREITIVDKKGVARTILMSGSVISDHEGRFVKAVESFWDITERKKSEEERLRLEEQNRQSQKMEALGTLAGGIAHDLNNILTPIMGYTHLCLMRGNLEPTTRENLQIIDKSALRAAELLSQILAFSRKQVLTLKPTNLNGIIHNFSKMLKRLIRENIDLTIDLENQLWTLDADSSRIEQILINLVVNARDAIPEHGNLLIQTRNETVAENTLYDMEHRPMNGDFVVLTVKDDGTGMDRATREKAFDPFFTTKESGRGTGIGLSTVYGIVRQHNGHILCDSTPGNGTSFHIYLPRVYAKQVEQQDQPPDPVKGGHETILVAEDSPDVRRAATSALRHFGYTTLEAANGAAALDLVSVSKNKKIDLLLTDVIMPGLGGKALAETLRLGNPLLPVVFMSGHTYDLNPHDLLKDNRTRFISKPFSPRDVANVVRELLDACNNDGGRDDEKDSGCISDDGAAGSPSDKGPGVRGGGEATGG